MAKGNPYKFKDQDGDIIECRNYDRGGGVIVTVNEMAAVGAYGDAAHLRGLQAWARRLATMCEAEAVKLEGRETK